MKEFLAEIVAGSHPGAMRPTSCGSTCRRAFSQTLQERGAWRSVAFMGGTALRFLYGIPRFSEDLDFALEDRGCGLRLRRPR